MGRPGAGQPIHPEEGNGSCCRAILEGCWAGGWQPSLPLAVPLAWAQLPSEAAIP